MNVRAKCMWKKRNKQKQNKNKNLPDKKLDYQMMNPKIFNVK